MTFYLQVSNIFCTFVRKLQKRAFGGAIRFCGCKSTTFF